MANIKEKIEKRRRISKEDALDVLKGHFQQLFKAYYEALERYNDEISLTIPEARTRLCSSLLNAKLTESFMLNFPDRWWLGKYKRVIFRWNGISMLIKKLDKNSYPSYMPTILSDAITNQMQIPLFDCDEAKEDTILFFGYTKLGNGELVSPRIVFYDGEVQWIADMDDIITKPAAKPIEKPNVRLRQVGKKKEAE